MCEFSVFFHIFYREANKELDSSQRKLRGDSCRRTGAITGQLEPGGPLPSVVGDRVTSPAATASVPGCSSRTGRFHLEPQVRNRNPRTREAWEIFFLFTGLKRRPNQTACDPTVRSALYRPPVLGSVRFLAS